MSKNMQALRKSRATNLTERREAQRFKVDWTIRVSAPKADGSVLEEEGILRDISSTGSYGLFTNPFEVGASVRVMIQLPLRRQGWISYPATVLRVEPSDSCAGIALIFDAVRPSFVVADPWS
jgi:hypothetical protein